MKRTWQLLEVVAGLTFLMALALGLAAAFRAMSGSGAAGTVAGTSQGYPPPQWTGPIPPTPSLSPQGYPPSLATEVYLASLPAPEATALIATQIAEQTVMVATMMVEMTASAPAPLPTISYPLVGPKCYIDSLNHFSLNLPAGWYADPPPPPDAVGGASVIYNYDPSKVIVGDGGFPTGSLKIQISSDKLGANQSFEQWLSNLIAVDTSSTAPVPLTTTQPSPYKLGKYAGSSFVLMGYGPNILEIAFPSGNGRVLIIGLIPAESSALSEGLSILTASLTVSPEPFCS